MRWMQCYILFQYLFMICHVMDDMICKFYGMIMYANVMDTFLFMYFLCNFMMECMHMDVWMENAMYAYDICNGLRCLE